MKNLKLLVIVVIVGLFGVSSIGADDNQNKYYKQKRDRNYMRDIYKQLDLSDEQNKQMKEHRAIMKKNRIKRKADRKANRRSHLIDISLYVSKDGFDKEAYINAKMKRIKNRMENRAVMLEKSMNILTPQQRVHLVELMQKKKK